MFKFLQNATKKRNSNKVGKVKAPYYPTKQEAEQAKQLGIDLNLIMDNLTLRDDVDPYGELPPFKHEYYPSCFKEAKTETGTFHCQDSYLFNVFMTYVYTAISNYHPDGTFKEISERTKSANKYCFTVLENEEQLSASTLRTIDNFKHADLHTLLFSFVFSQFAYINLKELTDFMLPITRARFYKQLEHSKYKFTTMEELNESLESGNMDALDALSEYANYKMLHLEFLDVAEWAQLCQNFPDLTVLAKHIFDVRIQLGLHNGEPANDAILIAINNLLNTEDCIRKDMQDPKKNYCLECLNDPSMHEEYMAGSIDKGIDVAESFLKQFFEGFKNYYLETIYGIKDDSMIHYETVHDSTGLKCFFEKYVHEISFDWTITAAFFFGQKAILGTSSGEKVPEELSKSLLLERGWTPLNNDNDAFGYEMDWTPPFMNHKEFVESNFGDIEAYILESSGGGTPIYACIQMHLYCFIKPLATIIGKNESFFTLTSAFPIFASSNTSHTADLNFNPLRDAIGSI